MGLYPTKLGSGGTAVLTNAELDVLDGVTAGQVTAGKAVVATTDKHIDAIAITEGGLALGAGAGTAVTSTAAELNFLDGVLANGVAVASKALVLGATKNIDTIDVTKDGLEIGGTAMTCTAAELNTLDGVAATLTAAELNILDGCTATAASLNNAQSFFDHTVTAVEVKACNHVVVPAIAGKQFFPTFAAMVATGDVTTSTVITLQESTSGGVVLSHVAADMTSGTWVGPTGGTVVTTLLNTALTVAEGIIVADTAANSLTVTTAIRVIVAGYYI